MKFISVPVFIISLAIGLFLSYIVMPRPEVILVYPTPDNINTIQYKDQSGTCFGFTAKKIRCPKDNASVREYPVQESSSGK